MMDIWYQCDSKNKSYFKFILFNSLKIKIIKNDSLKRINQVVNRFEDSANFLDTIMGLFDLPTIELAELVIWMQEHY